MVAMVVSVESLSRNSFLLEADLLIDLDRPMIIRDHGQSESMEPSLLRQLEWAVRQAKSPLFETVARAVAQMERDVIKRT